MVSNTTYFFLLKIKNNGQAIWEESQGYRFTTEGTGIQTSLVPTVISHIKPDEMIDLPITVKTPGDAGTYTLKISLVRNNIFLGNPIVKTITVRSPEVAGAQTETKTNPQQREVWRIFLKKLFSLTYMIQYGILNKYDRAIHG